MSDVFEICSESFSVCGVVCVLIACLLVFFLLEACGPRRVCYPPTNEGST